MKNTEIWKKVISPNEKIIMEFSLGKRYILLLQGVIAIGGIITLIFFWQGSLVFFGLMYFMGWFLKKANAYCLTEKRILVCTGWPSTRLVSVDYDKITDIVVKENFLEKLICNTGDIIINTAGSTKPEIILTHIENPYEIKKKIDQMKDKTPP